MLEVVRMPLMSDTMTEGTIVEWHKNVGDSISAGDVLAEIETDKATMEFESPEDGVLLHIGPKVGDTVPVNVIIAIIGDKGEDFQSILDAEASGSSAVSEPAPEVLAEKPAVVAQSAPTVTETAPIKTITTVPGGQTAASENGSSDNRLKASPLAKRLAAENNIDLHSVSGSGDHGRIIKRDIESVLANPQTQAVAPAVAPAATAAVYMPSAPVGQDSFEDVPLSNMRKVIARRLSESKFGAPHFYLTIAVNMDKVWNARKSMNEMSPVKISFNDIVIKACAMALRHHPAVNADWLTDRIRYNHHVHIGMAVAVDDGLVVPVIRHADNKSLSQLANETNIAVDKAKNKKLSPDEMQGNTFSISNLGMMGIEEFTAIINPPNACIMAVGAIQQEPVVIDGELSVARMMKVTLSCDHRVVDGATGASFLQTFKAMLEDPLRILV